VSDRRHKGGERYELVLVAQPGEVPPIVRLRHLLKLALRGLRLKCVSVREVTIDPAAAPVEQADYVRTNPEQ
jgi:hypothetical protein